MQSSALVSRQLSLSVIFHLCGWRFCQSLAQLRAAGHLSGAGSTTPSVYKTVYGGLCLLWFVAHLKLWMLQL